MYYYPIEAYLFSNEKERVDLEGRGEEIEKNEGNCNQDILCKRKTLFSIKGGKVKNRK